MTITYPRSLPTSPSIRSNTFGLNWNIEEMENPVTRSRKTNERAGSRWEGVITLPKINDPTIRAEWKAWFASLKGSSKTFLLGDPDHTTPVGIADTGSDTPLLDEAGGVAAFVESFTTDGWRLSGTGLLVPGDYFSIANELKQVLEIVTSDGTGHATINFAPRTHRAIADNTPIIFENPTGLFNLAENTQSWDSNEFGVTDFTFAVEENLQP